MPVRTRTWIETNHWNFRREAAAIRKYIEISQASFKRAYEELQREISNRIDPNDEELIHFAYGERAEDLYHFDEYFPRINASTIFVGIYTLLEVEMSRICEGCSLRVRIW